MKRSDDEATDGIVPLWPTVFVRRHLEGHAEHNPALVKHIREMEKANRDLTTAYLESDFFNDAETSVQWLKTGINAVVIDYFRWLGMAYPIDWSLQGWPNINRFGDYHDLHNHPRAYLSGTYYVKIPERQERLHTRNDVRPGCITFYDPRYGANMTAIKGDPYVEPEYTVAPRPGLMMMWPAFVNHFVHPNLSKEQRISISFNVMLKWSDRYLPDSA